MLNIKLRFGACLIAFCLLSAPATANEEFFVPFPEDHTLSFLQGIGSDSSCGPGDSFPAPNPDQPINTVTDFVVRVDGTVIVVDHWEDGYEGDLGLIALGGGALTPSTTRVYGDNNASNGAVPGVVNDAGDVLVQGQVVVFEESVNTATQLNDIEVRFESITGSVGVRSQDGLDGGDRIFSTETINVTRAQWAGTYDAADLPNSQSGTLFAGAFELFPLSQWGDSFTLPVAENSGLQEFEWTGLTVMAANDGTSVSIDSNADGDFTDPDDVNAQIINRGESIEVRGRNNTGGETTGGMGQGARVFSSDIVQVNTISGEECSTYASRWFTLFPDALLGNTYYEPVSTPADDATVIHLYNPSFAEITVNWETSVGLQTPIVIPAGSNQQQVIPTGTGARFFTGNTSTFGAFTVTDQNGTAHDWGHASTSDRLMGNIVQVGYAEGDDPSSDLAYGSGGENAAPVWLIADNLTDLSDTQYEICVDVAGDGGPNTDPNTGATYDYTFTLDRLDSARLYDGGRDTPNNVPAHIDGDQSGMLAFVCDGSDAILAAAWGQDPNTASGAAPAVDVGTTVRSVSADVAYLGDTIFEDVNNDGVRNPGEPGIQNVTVILTPPPSVNLGFGPGQSIITSTDFNGSYLFTSLVNAVYTIEVIPPAMFTQTADPDAANGDPVNFDDTATPTITNSSGRLDQDFGYNNGVPVGNVGDFIYGDLNGNGIQEPGEPGIPGITVELCNSSLVCITDVTDANGEYLFTGQVSDVYTVTVQNPPVGTTNTDDPGNDANNTNQFALFGTGGNLEQDFGYFTPAVVIGHIYLDTNGNGVQDVGEPNVPNLNVEITDSLGNLQTVTTDSNGDYSVTVAPGTTQVNIDETDPDYPSGYIQTDGVDPNNVIAVAGATVDAGDDGYFIGNAIGDTVYEENGGNNTQNAGDPGIPNVTVTLTPPAGVDLGLGLGAPISVLTDANGHYIFVGLPDGTYTVTVDQPSGSTQTEDPDAALDSASTVSVSGGTINTVQDFGYDNTVATGLVGDRVYTDTNGNGVQDVGELGIAGIVMQICGDLDDNNGTPNTCRTETTDADGDYLFGDNAPANGVGTDPNDDPLPDSELFTVTVTNPPVGQINSEDPDAGLPNFSQLTLTAGGGNLDQDFGYFVPATVTGHLYIDSNGNGVQDGAEIDLVGVDVVITDANGNQQTVTSDINGDYSAQVPPGTTTTNVDENDAQYPLNHTQTEGSDPTAVTAVAGNTVSAGNDGYAPLGLIGDLVFFDSAGSGTTGVYDPGVDVGIPNVLVTLTPLAGVDLGSGPGVGISVLTDANGNYSFGSLPPGDYTVSVAAPGGTTQTVDPNEVGTCSTCDSASAVTLTAGETNSTQDFGYQSAIPAGRIGDKIFYDTNNNGLFDGADTGIPGIIVQLCGDLDNNDLTADTCRTETTDADGDYLFGDGFEGDGITADGSDTGIPGTTGTEDYTLTVTNPPVGATNVVDPDGSTPNVAQLTLPSGVANIDQDFGYSANFISIDKSSSANGLPVSVGETITYTIVVSNTGPLTLENVVVNDLLPAGVTYTTTPFSARKTYGNSGSPAVAASFTTPNLGPVDHDGGAALVLAFDTTGIIPVGAGLVDYSYNLAGDSVNDSWRSEIDVVASHPSGTAFTTDYGDDLGQPDGGGSYNVTEGPVAVSGTAIGNMQLSITEDFNDGGPDIDNQIATATITVNYLVPAVPFSSVTDAAGSPPSLITAGEGFDLAPGEIVTIELNVVVDDPLAAGISEFLNTASANSDQTPTPVEDSVLDRLQTGLISGRVWLDEDQDGILDVEEAGLTDVTVYLCSNPVALGECDPTDPEYLETVITDQNGNYAFNGLAGGDYEVAVNDATYPTGLINTAGQFGVDPRDVTLPSGGEVTGQNFGYIADTNTGVIGDRVWSDADGDGIQDLGEAGINDVTVSLLNSSGVVIDTTVTDADGDYLFTNIPFGDDYTVQVDSGDADLAGFTPTVGPQSEGGYVSNPVSLSTSLTTVTDLDFGFDSATTITINDRVWFDQDGDAIADASEPGISGVTIDLLDNNGDIVASTVTDANGDFSFTGVPEGSNYQLVVSDRNDALNGLDETTSTSGSATITGSLTTAAGAGGVLDTVGDDFTDTFGYNAVGLIAGTVYQDADQNSSQDPSESGLAGVIVTLEDDLGNVIAKVRTDSDGHYEFASLPPGDYVIIVAPPLTTTQTEDPDFLVDNTTLVSIAVGESSVDNDFGYYSASLNGIFGTVFLDPDKDGVEEAGEPGIPSVTLALIDENILMLNIINGLIDVNDDGVVNGSDDGIVNGFTIIDGAIDIDADGNIDEDDNGQAYNYDVVEGVINIAQLGTANQSSTDWEGDLDPHVAVDGNPAGGVPVVTVGPFIHTSNASATEYWELDLGSVQSLASIKIYNRDGGGIEDRLTNVRVLVSDTPFPADVNDFAGSLSNADFDYQIVNADLNDPDIDLGGINGQYIRIQKSGTGNITNFLHFAEVSVVPAYIPAPSDNVIATTTTDANGDYSFLGLPDGDYQVAVTDTAAQLAGYDITSGLDILDVTIAGADEVDVDFGYIREEATGSISGEVFIDEEDVLGNTNGLADDPEFNFSNVTVYLCLASNAPCNAGNQIQTTTTDANGEYVFNDLPPGTYSVDVEPTDPDIPASLDLTVDPAPIALSEGEDVTDVDIGYEPQANTGVLSGFAWVDVDSDGVHDNGEAPIAGLLVRVLDITNPTNPAGDTIATTTTAADGTWIVSGISGANLQDDIVVVYDDSTVPTQLEPVQPTNLPLGDTDYIDIDLLSDSDNNISFLDFAFPPLTGAAGTLGSISGTIYSDADENDTYASGPDGELQLVTLNLVNCGTGTCNDGDESLIASTSTDSDGDYSFTGLPDGNYAVVITDSNNTLQDLNPNADVIAAPINIDTSVPANTPAYQITDQNAGYTSDLELGSIGNKFWFDINGDGQIQDNEPGIEGVVIRIWIDANPLDTADSPGSTTSAPIPGEDNLVRTVTTDENGEYYLTSLPAGQYIIEVFDALDFNEADDGTTVPGSAADGFAKPWVYAISKVDGAPNFAADFGVTGSNSLSGTVFVEDISLVEPVGATPTVTELDGVAGGTSPDTAALGGAEVTGIPVDLYVSGPGGSLTLIQSTVTDSNGDYSFTGLPDGDYRVEVNSSGTGIDGYGQTGDPDLAAVATLSGNDSDLVCDSPTAALCDNATGTLITLNTSTTPVTGVDFGYQKNYTTTPVNMDYFSAKANGGSVEFVWQTSNEIGHAGFQIYAREKNGWELISDLIVGQAGAELDARTYRYEISGVSAKWFALVAVSNQEEVTPYGPFHVGEEYGQDMILPDAFDWAEVDFGETPVEDVSTSLSERLWQLLDQEERDARN